MAPIVQLLTIFVLAIFVGFLVITRVPPLLHTPLMSGSNAISGITIVGAILAVTTPRPMSTVLGFIAIVFASINVVGGFLVTNRMLGMFKRKEPTAAVGPGGATRALGPGTPSGDGQRS